MNNHKTKQILTLIFILIFTYVSTFVGLSIFNAKKTKQLPPNDKHIEFELIRLPAQESVLIDEFKDKDAHFLWGLYLLDTKEFVGIDATGEIVWKLKHSLSDEIDEATLPIIAKNKILYLNNGRMQILNIATGEIEKTLSCSKGSGVDISFVPVNNKVVFLCEVADKESIYYVADIYGVDKYLKPEITVKLQDLVKPFAEVPGKIFVYVNSPFEDSPAVFSINLSAGKLEELDGKEPLQTGVTVFKEAKDESFKKYGCFIGYKDQWLLGLSGGVWEFINAGELSENEKNAVLDLLNNNIHDCSRIAKVVYSKTYIDIQVDNDKIISIRIH